MQNTAQIIQLEPDADDVVEGILVTLSIRHWKGRAIDEDATTKVASDNSVTPDVGAYHKRLFEKHALGTISQDVYKARQDHWWLTMPWADTGQRLLPAANIELYAAKMKEWQNKIDGGVKKFLAKYDEYKDGAKVALGGLYKEDDYGSVDEIAAKFSFNLQYGVLPTDDLRVSMSEETRRELCASIRKDTEQRIYASVEDKLQLLVDQLLHYRDKVCAEHPDPEKQGKAKSFKIAGLRNVGRELAIVRAINLTNDPRLISVCDKVEGLANEIGMTLDTAEVHATQIRNNPTYRENQRKKADDMLKRMGFA